MIMYTLMVAAILMGGNILSQALETYETVEECITDRDITRQTFQMKGLEIVCVDEHNKQVELDAPTDGGML